LLPLLPPRGDRDRERERDERRPRGDRDRPPERERLRRDLRRGDRDRERERDEAFFFFSVDLDRERDRDDLRRLTGDDERFLLSPFGLSDETTAGAAVSLI
jgi:hypothetical protein